MVTILQEPQTKTLDEYEFTFDAGIVMPITVDEASGDQIEFGDRVVLVSLVSKVNPNDSEKILPAEDVTIFYQKLLSVQHRKRQITLLTPEQEFEWKKTLKGFALQ